MEEWFRKDGCDGFNIMPPFLPGGLDDFVDLVIPELQRRGLFRTEYEGKTLRENLGLKRPASRHAEAARDAPARRIGRVMVISVKRLGHATLTTPDIDRQIAYYTEVVGLTLVERSKDRAYLACKLGLEAIALEPGKGNALSRIAFQVAPDTDLGDVSRALAKRWREVPNGAAAFRRASPRRWCSPIPRARRSRFFPTMFSPRMTAAAPASCRSSSAMSPIGSTTCRRP